MLKTILNFGDNENWLIRIIRVGVMAGLSAGAVAIIQALPNIDIPGDFDALIVAGLTAILTGVDKYARAQQ